MCRQSTYAMSIGCPKNHRRFIQNFGCARSWQHKAFGGFPDAEVRTAVIASTRMLSALLMRINCFPGGAGADTHRPTKGGHCSMSNVAQFAPLDLDTRQPPVLSRSDYERETRRHGNVTVEPYAPVIGGEVTGFSFDAPVDEDTRRFLYKSLLDFGFLSFVPGSIREANFEAFTGLFGKARFSGNPQAPRVAADSQSNAIDSETKQTRTNYIWHIDQAYRPSPQKFTALYALKAPSRGGETLFANASAALSLLDPKFVSYLETLSVIHDVETQGLLSLAYQDPQALAEARVKAPPLEVPLIRVHPETGKRQIFANELYAQRILGVSRNVSDHLLGIIFDLIKQPEIGAIYTWREGAVLVWDNRAVQHRGVYNYDEQRRSLKRAVID